MKKLFLLTFLITALISCEKDNSNGNILAKVKHDGHIVSSGIVYLNKGEPANKKDFSQYEKMQSTDGSGEVYFENLNPGDYFIYSRGFDTCTKTYLEGESKVTIRSRYRGNEEVVSIQLIK